MTVLPSLTPRPPEHPLWLAAKLALLALALVLFGPLTVFGAALCFRLRPDRSRPGPFLIWLAAALLGGLGLFLLWPVLLATVGAAYAPDSTDPPIRRLLRIGILWLATLPLIPLGAVSMTIWQRLRRQLGERTIQDQADAAEAHRLLREREAAVRTERLAEAGGRVPPRTLLLGAYNKGDSFPEEIGIRHTGRSVGLAEWVLDQHCFVLGATGMGKTEALKRLIHELFTQLPERDLFVVDGKGDAKLATDVRNLAWQCGRGETPIVRLGQDRPGAIYDGFRGSAGDIYSRLVAMLRLEEMSGDSIYHANTIRGLLHLLCHAPGGPPRAFEEVEERSSREWLRGAYADNPAKLAAINKFGEKDFAGMLRHIQTYIWAFTPFVGPDGFCLERERTAVFSLRTPSMGDTAKRFLNFLLEDLKDFTGKRQRRPAVLLIDEFGAFGNENVMGLLEMARSAKCGVILATQDIASLGDERMQRRILASCRTKLLLGTDYPEEMIAFAGTVIRVENTIQHEEGRPTGLGSGRPQHTFKVTPGEVGQLIRGQAFLIRQRYACKLHVRLIEEPQPAPPEPVVARVPRVVTAPEWVEAPTPPKAPRQQPRVEAPASPQTVPGPDGRRKPRRVEF